MALTAPEKDLARYVAERVHKEDLRAAAEAISDFCKLDMSFKDASPAEIIVPIQHYLHHLLDNGGMPEAAQILWTPNQFNPNPECSKQVWQLFDEANFGLIMGAGSMSKCLGVREPCRMADGAIRAAEDVVVGDRLAGDDGTARTVLDTIRGKAQMYRVSPSGAPSFVCTGDHVLSLICTVSKRNSGGHGNFSSCYTPGTTVDIPLCDYLKWSATRKEAYRLFLRPAPMPKKEVPVDPYIYGAWLGDGTRVRAEITTPGGPMSRRWVDYWQSVGFRVHNRTEGDYCGVWSVRSKKQSKYSGRGGGFEIWPNAWLRKSVVNGEKRIGAEYLFNDAGTREKVLAGLVDSDGTARGAGFEITTKWAGLADDIEALARSLGFAVTRFVRTHGIKSLGFTGEYHHVYLRGDCGRIPTLEKRARRISYRGIDRKTGDVTASFEVSPVGEQSFAGFFLDGNHRFLLGSGVVTHNSFTMGVRLFLEWLRDPANTTIKVLGPSEEHLEQNLFSHLVGLHQKATLPMPGEVGELYIGLDRRDQVSAIRGTVIPVGKTKKAGRLQGAKRKPRATVHPVFGNLTRLFIFIDEIENVPGGLWSDIDNVMSNLDSLDSCGLKIFGAYNPTNPADEVGKRAEPEFGWQSFDIDRHFRWKSKRGWEVLRLDGEKSENVIAGKILFPGLQTQVGLDAIAKNAGGRSSPGYMAMGRGAYPMAGVEMTVVPPGLFLKMRGEFIWYDSPIAVGSCDLALEGGASALFSLGKWGQASGMKLPPSVEFPSGQTIMFKDPSGRVAPRWGLLLEQQFALPKGDTVAMSTELIRLCRRAGIRPNYFCCDRTGHGQGIADLMKHNWGSIIAINYSESATDAKAMVEDSKKCNEEYSRLCCELWFVMRKWAEFGYVLIHPQVDTGKLSQQLTLRTFRSSGAKVKVESKKDYMSRGFSSPDEADSFCQFVHAARVGSGVTPSMAGGTVTPDEDDGWEHSQFPNGVLIDPSNQTDWLNEQADDDNARAAAAWETTLQ